MKKFFILLSAGTVFAFASCSTTSVSCCGSCKIGKCGTGACDADCECAKCKAKAN